MLVGKPYYTPTRLNFGGYSFFFNHIYQGVFKALYGPIKWKFLIGDMK